MQLYLSVCKASRRNALHDGRLTVKALRRIHSYREVHFIDADIIGLRGAVALNRKRCIAVVTDRERDVCRGVAQYRSIRERNLVEIGDVERLRFNQQSFQPLTCFFHEANTFLDVANSTDRADQSLKAKF